ncbi:phage holin family protein [Candidatus Gracilibacteria bacterium]|nr:phage holin family protein [Candidatus Gracilibacteria bacterium]
MKILFSIIANAGILFAMTYLLGPSIDGSVAAGITLGCGDCSYTSLAAWKTYITGGIVLGALNVTIRPILKLLSLPLFFVFFGLVVFIVNGVLLKLFDYIVNQVLIIPGVAYTIHGWQNFIIAVAIFTVLNMVYSILFSKK